MSAPRPAHLLRRTGADPPFGDPRGYHAAPMEGHYWRFVGDDGVVVVTLCGLTRHGRGGPEVLTAIATSTGLLAVREAHRGDGDPHTLGLDVPDVFTASPGHVRAHCGTAALALTMPGPPRWPRRAFGGLGPAGALPGMSQYWHPHTLGVRAHGTLTSRDGTRHLEGLVYAEKNWGPAFPERWWWVQGHTAGTMVALAGGRVRVGPVALTATSVVVRRHGRLWRFGLPTGVVGADVGDGVWRMRGRRGLTTVTVEARPGNAPPARLPVPRPAADAPLGFVEQHLDGTLHVTLRERHRTVLDEVIPHAGMEAGDLHPAG